MKLIAWFLPTWKVTRNFIWFVRFLLIYKVTNATKLRHLVLQHLKKKPEFHNSAQQIKIVDLLYVHQEIETVNLFTLD
jgi:hypothetical protein